MPRRDQVTRHGAIESIREYIARPTVLRVKARRFVHERSTTAGRCPCCNNPHAKVCEASDYADLLIDTTDQWRTLRGRGMDPGAYDELVSEVEPAEVELPIRCSVYTEAATFDRRTRTIVATGGARSTKTQTGSYWSAVQWLHRGGSGVHGAFVAPSLSLASVLLEKWVKGEGDPGGDDWNPPVIPPELIVSAPRPDKLRDPSTRKIVLVDGTTVLIVESDPSKLSARALAWWQWTEAALSRDPKAYFRLRGRVMSTGGQGFVDVVPEPRNWCGTVFIERSENEELAEREAAAKGEAFKRTIRRLELGSAKNVFIDPNEATEFESELHAIDPRAAAREAGGQWIGDANLLFADVYDGSRHTYASDEFDLAAIRVEHEGRVVELEDITEQASMRYFARPHPWIVAVDVNANPHTALCCKIAVPMGALPQNPHNWHVVIAHLLQVWRDLRGQAKSDGDPKAGDSFEAAATLAEFEGGIFSSAGILMDSTAMYHRHNSGGLGNQRRGHTAKEAYEAQGFEVLGPQLHFSRSKLAHIFQNPDRADTGNIWRPLFRANRVHINRTRCGRVIRAVRDQETEDDGVTPVKQGSTNQDRYIASITDCMRYIGSPFFDVPAEEQGQSRATSFA